MKFVILKNTVGDRDNFQRTLEEHHQFLESLHEKNAILLAGTFEDHSGGMMLVEASSLEQAISIARADPMVRAGVDRYLVRGWDQTFDASHAKEQDASQMNLPIRHIDSGPIHLPPAAENFRLVEAAAHPRATELMAQCFAPDQIAADDPARRNYLRGAERAGIHKLLLIHTEPEEQVAGQIEFGPPQAAGIPVSGDSLTVINCLWVLDAFTGLDGGQLLLAACAERAGTQSLATIGYNGTLPWLSRGFFERQGFNLLDQVDTGRFFGNTPIIAFLLWRPLVDSATPPTWDKARLQDGISFCPGYPWMFGKRMYWGRDFSYHGTVVREGLRRPEVLSQFPILDTKRVGNWTLIKIGFPEVDLHRVVQVLQAALMDEPTYFANLYGGHDDRVVAVFPERVFRMSRDRATWKAAASYGIERGIPKDELVFGPSNYGED